MRMMLATATLEWGDWKNCLASWDYHRVTHPLLMVVKGKTIIEAYQEIWEAAKQDEVDAIAYVHDDTICYEPGWDARVILEFEDPEVGVVGFGGGIGHGDPDMYRKPYELPQLARRCFISNMRSAEVHGARYQHARNVAVLDGFALIVRREVLDKTNGWPQDGTVGYYLYSEWLCCMARRLGYRIRMVGVDCEHLGGRSSGLKPEQKFDFEGEHKWLYDNFRDVLPYTAEGR